MESTFSGLSTALSALYSQKRGLDVAGQNIANANTDGYTRQRVELRAIGGSATGAIFSVDSGVGSGVEVASVTRAQDALMQARVRTEHAQDAYLTTQQRSYSQIEQIFTEPSDTGLHNQMGELWTSFQNLANNPGDLATRATVLQQARVVVDGLTTAHTNLDSIWTTSRQLLDSSVSEINTAADTVAQLNTAILQGSGGATNSLADRRDAAVVRLAELTGAGVLTRADGTVDVYLSGSALVSGGRARHVESGGANRMADESISAIGPVSLQWTDTHTPAALAGGEVGADLQILNTLVPGQSGRLDLLAGSLITTVNTQHTAGYDLDGNAGQPLFTGTSAADIAVGLTDPRQVAASATAGGTLDGSNADALASTATAASGPDVTYRQMVADLGVAAQGASQRAAIQATVKQQVDSDQQAQSGVNLDEEMTNMLSYQRAYQAASRLLTTIDSVLDTLINHMGVG